MERKRTVSPAKNDDQREEEIHDQTKRDTWKRDKESGIMDRAMWHSRTHGQFISPSFFASLPVRLVLFLLAHERKGGVVEFKTSSWPTW